MSLPAGARIGVFEIVSKIGQGGMGEASMPKGEETPPQVRVILNWQQELDRRLPR